MLILDKKFLSGIALGPHVNLNMTRDQAQVKTCKVKLVLKFNVTLVYS